MKGTLPHLKQMYHSHDGEALWEYFIRFKLPLYAEKAAAAVAKGSRADTRLKPHIMEFGHNVIFGELAVALLLFPAQVKVIRLRRNPCELAVSFLCVQKIASRKEDCPRVATLLLLG